MIGVYQDSFLGMLKEKLGDPVKVTNKSIICRCPWCELDQNKKHYHLFIFLPFPYFKCYHAGCNMKGSISKLLKKLNGKDESDKFIDSEKVSKKVIEYTQYKEYQELIIPELSERGFEDKDFYIKKRLKFNVDPKTIKGLIYDIDKFISVNNIEISNKYKRISPFFQSNFVGFLTEFNSILCLRNIDNSSDFRYFNLSTEKSSANFLDYYKIQSMNYNSNLVVMAEGIFDIYTEHIFDNLKLKKDTKMLVSGLSTNYDSLIKSIVFNENIYKLKLVILSDKGLSLDFYRKIKNKNKHVIDSMEVYYNKTGKDFNVTPVFPEKFLI